MDPTEFRQTPKDIVPDEVVILTDGTTLPSQGIVHVPLTIQGYKETIPCVVIALADDYDIILGDAWL